MPPRAILAALLSVSFLGINWSATKIALQDFSPYMVLTLRFTTICLVLAPFVWRYPRPDLKKMALLGLMLLIVQFSLSFVALDMGLSVTSGVIASQLGVPFTCILSAIFFKDYLGRWRSFGMMIAFFGVLLVAGTPNASEHWGAFALAVLSSFAAAAGFLYLKTIKPTPSLIAILFWPAVFATPCFALLSLLFEHGQWAAIHSAHLNSWLGIAYGVFITSFIGHSLWNWLITTYPMSRVAPYGLLIPVAGILGGVLMFHDPLTLQVLLGAVLTIVGVAVITLRHPKLAEVEG